jgi:hypothetical protein
MSDRLALEKQDIIAERGGRCEVCGRPVSQGQPQLAHRIPQRKHVIRRYGADVIHHPLNLALTCSLVCNARVSIAGSPVAMEMLYEQIKAEIDRDGDTHR